MEARSNSDCFDDYSLLQADEPVSNFHFSLVINVNLTYAYMYREIARIGNYPIKAGKAEKAGSIHPEADSIV